MQLSWNPAQNPPASWTSSSGWLQQRPRSGHCWPPAVGWPRSFRSSTVVVVAAVAGATSCVVAVAFAAVVVVVDDDGVGYGGPDGCGAGGCAFVGGYSGVDYDGGADYFGAAVARECGD